MASGWMKGEVVVAQECCSRAHRVAANVFPGSRLRRGSEGRADRTERKGRNTHQTAKGGMGGRGRKQERSLTQTQTAQRGKTGFATREREVVVGWRGKWRVEGWFAYGTAKTSKPTTGLRQDRQAATTGPCRIRPMASHCFSRSLPLFALPPFPSAPREAGPRP